MIRRRRAWRGRALGALVAVILASTAPAAVAAPAPSPSPPAGQPNPPASGASTRWSVAPANANGPDGRTRYSYEDVRPGALVSDYVSITNLSNAPVTFRVYSADGITTPQGSIGLANADVEPTDVGAWTRVAHGTVRVEAGSRVVEPFTIRVPANATPGDHVGGMIASITEKAPGGQVTRESRVAVAAYLRVTGPLTATLGVEAVSTSYHGTANPFGGGGVAVAYTVRNTGNVRLAGTQAVSLTSMFGTEATAEPPALDELLPGDAVRVAVFMSGVLPAGSLNAHVTVTPVEVPRAPRVSASLEPAAQVVSLWATPWPQIILLLILVAVGVGLRWWLLWSRRWFNARLAAAEERGRRAAPGTPTDDGVAVFDGADDSFTPVGAGPNGTRAGGHHGVDTDRAGEAAPPAASDPD